MRKKFKLKRNPLEVANNTVRLKPNEEFGLMTVSHPNKNNSKKLSLEEVINKMDENQGGMA
ncbi:hypothetical protein [Lysinibacillus endophyticus]|uniref:Uncharacterized protein n=1 Tax=Ureibacillus endophyticus TaxID=1978490 RepID=A0A494Z7B3_9BACL|nr:hypothetical protein [Lysinibacillus endophyticus]MCP1145048.1 hypothetical protein [Lysinibacillus endophyticus]RKQ18472.1 hypothetical protein D8M03_05350 [Lysinibacillus endophyticus]